MEEAARAGRNGVHAVVSQVRRNLAFQAWSEINETMGDLGTYIPLILALSLAKELDLGTTLIFTGLYNILTGALHGVPMPVQPMKSIAAVAISGDPNEFGVPEIMAAGMWTSAVVYFLGVIGLMRLVYTYIPLPAVRGVQLAQGLSFALTAVRYVRNEQDLAKGKSLGSRPWLGLDGLVLALVAAVFILLVNGAGDTSNPRNQEEEEEQQVSTRRNTWSVVTSLPSAVIVFVLGVVLAVVRKRRFSKASNSDRQRCT